MKFSKTGLKNKNLHTSSDNKTGVRYEKFDPKHVAKLALNYVTRMSDKANDYLPYWIVAAHENPAFAKHCRVDDAELVASWYEAIVAVQDILGTDEGEDVKQGFLRHLMKSWGPMGLRYHEPYPWSHTNHSSFHEMAYILGALNRAYTLTGRQDVLEKAKGLVAGMRALVIKREVRTFWAGDTPVEEAIYEFPNDVYLRDGGFDFRCFTGRGEPSIRNAMMLLPLVMYWEMTKDDVALDLAVGTANFLLGTSRYFNWKMEFFGHVHSTVWFAGGLIRLGRNIGNNAYIQKGKGIYDYVRSLSGSFGWVPEYAQWHPADEEWCETCCIKDMIICAGELIDCGFEEYYEDLNSFTRNQLAVNQFQLGGFVAVDNSIPDTNEATWQDIDKRIVGGFSGGSLPNAISLTKFRAIAGCCVGTAPQALQMFWHRAVQWDDSRLTVNMQIDRDLPQASVFVGYPNEGLIRITAKENMNIAIRLYPWMGEDFAVYRNGTKESPAIEGSLAVLKDVAEGTVIELRHDIVERNITETVAGREYTAIYHGPDVVDMLPHPDENDLRLYQRVEGAEKVCPAPKAELTSGKGFYIAPTQQK